LPPLLICARRSMTTFFTRLANSPFQAEQFL